MDPTMTWVIVAAAVVVVAVVLWVAFRRPSSARLRERFGPEYDHAVREHGSAKKAEAELAQRMRRVERLHIRPLSQADATRYGDTWRIVQGRFVDEPGGAVTEADRLVGEVMAARGYPVGEFEQRVADISVDHPDVVVNYRAAREIAVLHARGEASTEDLRQAMVHYRALFADLLETADRPRESARDEVHERSHR